ncbi:MAG: carnitine dehydratase [Deltaproteobacteria bacterium]|nr:carnitine dehydratase [Deltaproteobacteria bacterium]
MAGVLDGIRVLDLTRGISGPMATMLLSDHGADVVRVEAPGEDPFRAQLGYRAWNRGKRSALLDLKQESDKQSFLALAAQADVVLESFAPGTVERLGIDYDSLANTNPRLIYCSITGYGRGNSHSDRPGYDALVAARSGLQWEQRGWVGGSAPHLAGRDPLFPDFEIHYDRLQGPPREGPIFPASRFPSLGAAYAATAGISAALRAREQTGRGQRVDTSLLQGALAAGVMAFGVAENLDAEHFMSWIGDSRSPKGLFECKDGRWVHAWPPNPRFILTAAEGDTLNATPDLTLREDPERLGLGVEEMFVLDHYYEPMAQAIKKFTADEWTEAAAIAGVCMQKIRTPEEGLTDPLLLDDGIIAEIDDPELGAIRTVGVLYNLDTSPGEIRGPAPTLGQHTEEIREEARRATPNQATDTGKKLPKGPLDGIRVLDFGLAVAGPYAGQVLSDLGAEVIKVNALYDWYWHSTQIAMCCNRGKSSIAIDLKHERSREVIGKLLESADVVIHNMRYRAAIKLGIDYASLKERYPRLVYCHTRGFEHGPREELPGNDQTGACLAGVEYEDGGCGRGGRPMWSLTNMGDTGNGFLAAIAVCQALFEREKTGRGQWCETAIVNAQLFNTSYAIARPDGTPIPRPMLDGMQTGFSAGVRLYPTADEWICLSLTTDAHWGALADTFALAELRAGGRFATAEARAANDEEVAKLLEHALSTTAGALAFEKLDRAGVPCELAPGDAAIRLWRENKLSEDQLITQYDHRMVGKLGHPGLACQFSDTPATVQGGPLLVGENTREILADLGFDETSTNALFAAGAVGDETVYPALSGDPDRVAISPWEPS